MNMMIRSVSYLARHIITEIILPRMEKLGQKIPNESVENFVALAKDDDRLYQLAKISVSGARERLKFLKSGDFEDFVSNVISTTIQESTNDYHEYLKSRHGFWGETYDVSGERGYADFGRTFSFFMLRAIQSESSVLKYRFKHEVGIIEDMDGEISLIDEVEEKRDELASYSNFSGFEKCVEKIKTFAETTKEFDELDRLIFNTWFSKKDNENFCEKINMIKDVYSPIIQSFEEKGNTISESALHFRWKRIRLFLKDSLLDS